MNRTSIAHRLLAASLGGLGLVLTALPAMAESQYGSGTGTITAQAKVNLSVTVPKLILLRVGSTNTTVDTAVSYTHLTLPTSDLV